MNCKRFRYFIYRNDMPMEKDVWKQLLYHYFVCDECRNMIIENSPKSSLTDEREALEVCPDIAALQRFVISGTEYSSGKRLIRHMNGCEKCRRTVSELIKQDETEDAWEITDDLSLLNGEAGELKESDDFRLERRVLAMNRREREAASATEKKHAFGVYSRRVKSVLKSGVLKPSPMTALKATGAVFAVLIVVFLCLNERLQVNPAPPDAHRKLSLALEEYHQYNGLEGYRIDGSYRCPYVNGWPLGAENAELRGKLSQAYENYKSKMGENDRSYRLESHYLIIMGKRNDETKELLRKRIHLSHGKPAAYNDLGVLMLLKKEIQEARKMFVKALERDPDYMPALFNLIIMNQENSVENFEVLEGYIEKYLANSSDDGWRSRIIEFREALRVFKSRKS